MCRRMSLVCKPSKVGLTLVTIIPTAFKEKSLTLQILGIATLTLRSPLTSQLHTTTASTTRQTPHAVLDNIVLLTMGVMMPETC